MTRGCLPAFASTSDYWPMLPFPDKAAIRITSAVLFLGILQIHQLKCGLEWCLFLVGLP